MILRRVRLRSTILLLGWLADLAASSRRAGDLLRPVGPRLARSVTGGRRRIGRWHDGEPGHRGGLGHRGGDRGRPAARGDVVICIDADPASARRTAAELRHAEAVELDVLDVRDEAGRASVTGALVERHGRLDVAVACAGIQVTAPAHELALDDFQRVLSVNLSGAFLTCRAAARAMIADGHGGKLVLVGSVNSSVALPGQAAYAASKGGCCCSAGRWRSTRRPMGSTSTWSGLGSPPPR